MAVQVADMPADVPLAELDEKSRLLPGGGERADRRGRRSWPILREMGYDGPVTVKPSRGAFQSRRRDVDRQADGRSAGQGVAGRRAAAHGRSGAAAGRRRTPTNAESE